MRSARQDSGRSVAWAVVILFVVLFLALAQLDLGHRLLVNAGLASEPATTTELYFDSQNVLSGSIDPGPPRPVSVSFYVGNASPVPRDIPWQVLGGSAGAPPRTLGQGIAAAVAPQERRSQSLEFLLECSPEPLKIVVSISGEPVEINRKITCLPPPPSLSE